MNRGRVDNLLPVDMKIRILLSAICVKMAFANYFYITLIINKQHGYSLYIPTN